jgi:hypothetical protein
MNLRTPNSAGGFLPRSLSAARSSSHQSFGNLQQLQFTNEDSEGDDEPLNSPNLFLHSIEERNHSNMTDSIGDLAAISGQNISNFNSNSNYSTVSPQPAVSALSHSSHPNDIPEFAAQSSVISASYQNRSQFVAIQSSQQLQNNETVDSSSDAEEIIYSGSEAEEESEGEQFLSDSQENLNSEVTSIYQNNLKLRDPSYRIHTNISAEQLVILQQFSRRIQQEARLSPTIQSEKISPRLGRAHSPTLQYFHLDSESLADDRNDATSNLHKSHRNNIFDLKVNIDIANNINLQNSLPAVNSAASLNTQFNNISFNSPATNHSGYLQPLLSKPIQHSYSAQIPFNFTKPLSSVINNQSTIHHNSGITRSNTSNSLATHVNNANDTWLVQQLQSLGSVLSHTSEDTAVLADIASYLALPTLNPLHTIQVLYNYGSALFWYLSARLNQILLYINSSNSPIVPSFENFHFCVQIVEFIAIYSTDSIINSTSSSSAYTSLKSAINAWLHTASKLVNTMKDAEIQITERCGITNVFVPEFLSQPSNYTYKHNVNELVEALNNVTLLTPVLLPSSNLCSKLRVGHIPNPLKLWQRDIKQNTHYNNSVVLNNIVNISSGSNVSPTHSVGSVNSNRSANSKSRKRRWSCGKCEQQAANANQSNNSGNNEAAASSSVSVLSGVSNGSSGSSGVGSVPRECSECARQQSAMNETKEEHIGRFTISDDIELAEERSVQSLPSVASITDLYHNHQISHKHHNHNNHSTAAAATVIAAGSSSTDAASNVSSEAARPLNVSLYQWINSILAIWPIFPPNIEEHIEPLALQICSNIFLMQELSWPLHRASSEYAVARAFLEFLINNDDITIQLLYAELTVGEIVAQKAAQNQELFHNLRANNSAGNSVSTHQSLYYTPVTPQRHSCLYRVLLAAVVQNDLKLLKFFKAVGLIDEFAASSVQLNPFNGKSGAPSTAISPQGATSLISPANYHALEDLLPYASLACLELLVYYGANVHLCQFRANAGEENIKEHEQLSVYVSFIVFCASSRTDAELIVQMYAKKITISAWEMTSVLQFALLHGIWKLAAYSIQNITDANALRLKSWLPAPTTTAGQNLIHTPDQQLRCGLFVSALDCLYQYLNSRPFPILRGYNKKMYLLWWSNLVLTHNSACTEIHSDLYWRIRQSAASSKQTNWSKFMLELYIYMKRLEKQRNVMSLIRKKIDSERIDARIPILITEFVDGKLQTESSGHKHNRKSTPGSKSASTNDLQSIQGNNNPNTNTNYAHIYHHSASGSNSAGIEYRAPAAHNS